MKLIKLKGITNVPQFDGISVEYELLDNDIKRVIFKQGDKVLYIDKGDGFSTTMSLSIPKPPVTQMQYVVSGQNKDGESRMKTFDNKTYAHDYLDTIIREGYTSLLEEKEVIIEE